MDAPARPGVYQAGPDDIDRALRNALFNGCVEACDGTVAEHETLVLTVTQLGVYLVYYKEGGFIGVPGVREVRCM